MPTFVCLFNWTDQGIKNVRETTKRAEKFKAAIKKAGTFDRKKVWQALRELKFSSMYGHFKVNETNMNQHEGVTFQILEGDRKLVWPKEMAEVKAQLPMPRWEDRAKR